MPLKSFADRKYEEIIKYVEANKELMDTDESFRLTVNKRLRQWLMLFTVATNEMTIAEFQEACKDCGFDGCITFFINKIQKKIRIIPDDLEKKYEKGVAEFRASEVSSIADIAKAFDADITEIK